MLTVTIGLGGALLFGAADFFGGIASKRISVLRVTAIVGVAGLIVLIALMPVFGGTWSWNAVLLGALSGVTGAIAISLLYASLAIGPMSILSPTTAVISAIVPALAGVIRGERLPSIGYAAIGLALVAIVLVGFVPEKRAVRPSPRALLMAIGSGTAIGAFLIIIDMTPDDSGLVPLLLNRAVNSGIMFVVIGVVAYVSWRRKQPARTPVIATDPVAELGRVAQEAPPPRDADAVTRRTTGEARSAAGGGDWRSGLVFAIIGGAIDAMANALLLFGLRMGELTVMSVLTALYPAGTILLAATVLKERIAPVQVVGLVLAIAAASMLALA